MRRDTLNREKSAGPLPGFPVRALTYTIFDGLQWASTRGLARYARQLRRHLEVAGWQERPAKHPNWTSGAGRVLICEVIEPLQQMVLRPQVAFYPHNVLPSLMPARTGLRILVLHDVLFLSGENRRSAGNRYRRMKLAHSLGGADLILTVSEASRAEIRRHLTREVEVLILRNCLAEAFAQLKPAMVRSLRAVPTILHFGGHAPSKNTRALFAAVGQLLRGGTEVRLEVAAMSTQAALVEQWRAAAGLPASAVRILPQLSDTELIETYRRADLHVMPSTGEGFGIPLIEAARTGVLNVLSPLDVFRELMGDAAIYAGGFDADALASALRAGLAADRASLAARAFVRSEDFVFEAVHRLDAEPALVHIAGLSVSGARTGRD